ncbi:MAG: hypothetical protein AcusKO_36740 [Acuticoccus sp.]
MPTLRQIRSVLAVYEEGSFTAAAMRENATQSGISQHVAAVESELALALFERAPEGVRPTPAGERYYARAVEALRALAAAETEARDVGELSGAVNAGLMPTFTRAVLAPALERLAAAHPNVSVRVFEGYSGTLTDMVRAGELDFALVPAFAPGAALVATPLGRDREMLVARAGAFAPGVPVAAATLAPLKLIAPSRANTRRARLDAYFAANGVAKRAHPGDGFDDGGRSTSSPGRTGSRCSPRCSWGPMATGRCGPSRRSRTRRSTPTSSPSSRHAIRCRRRHGRCWRC